MVFDQASGTQAGQTWTDANGIYAVPLASGTYRISLIGGSSWSGTQNAPQYFEGNSLVQNLVVSANTTQDFSLPFVTLSGKTSDINGVPIGNVTITQDNKSIAQPIGSYTCGNNQSPYLMSDASGNYSMILIPTTGYSETIIPPTGSGFSQTVINGINANVNILQNIILNIIDTQAPIISEPTVSAITDISVVVEWQTNEPAKGSVTSTPTGTSLAETTYATSHSQSLTGLSANTTYSITVTATDVAGNGPTTSAAVVFTTKPTPDITLPIPTVPIVTTITYNSAVVEWTTDKPSKGSVLYGLSDAFGWTVAEANFSTTHRVTLSGLSPEMMYYLEATAKDVVGNGPAITPIVTFRTVAVPDTTPPKIVEGPMAINISDTAATIIWTTDEPATSGVSWNNGTVYGVLTDPALTTSHSVRVTGLAASTAYTFTVSSKDAFNNGPTQKTATFTTLPNSDHNPPVILEGPTIKNVTHQSAVIYWVTDEQSNSVIEYNTVSAYNAAIANGTNPWNTDAKSDLVTMHNRPLTGLQSATTYYYRVKSTDSSGNGPTTSKVFSFTTESHPNLKPPVVTKTPMILYATDTFGTVYFETDNPCNTVVEYGQDGTLTNSQSNADTVNKHQTTITNLTPNTSYNVQVSCTDMSGNTVVASAGKPVTFLASNGDGATGSIGFMTTSQPDITPPVITLAPNLVGLSNTRATIHWQTDEISDSRVSYALQGQPLTLFAGDITQVTDHFVTLTNLSPGTAYSYQVGSVDPSSNGPTLSSTLSFTTASTADTTAPVISVVQNTPTSISAVITWLTDEAATSAVLYGIDSNNMTGQASTDGLTTSHTVTLTNLDPSTTYYYKLQSTDISNNTATGAVLSFTTATWTGSVTVPGAPSGVSATIGNGQSTVTFSAPSFNGGSSITGYTVLSSPTGGIDGSAGSTGLSHVITGLSNGTAYTFAVTATNSAGTGPFSADSNGVTPAAIPLVIVSGPAMTSVTNAAAVVGWQTNRPALCNIYYGTSTPPTTPINESSYRTSHSTTVSGLASDTLYYLDIASCIDQGNNSAGPGQIISFSTNPAPPPAPTISGIIVSAISYSSATIQWQTNVPATGSVSYGQTSSLGITVADPSTFTISHSVTLSGLAFGTPYYFKVSSANVSGSAESAVQQPFTTASSPDTTKPAIIGPGVIDISDTETTVIWETDEPATSAVSYYSLDGNGIQINVGSLADSALVTKHWVHVTGLLASTQYYFTPSSTDGFGNGPSSTPLSSITTLKTPDIFPPVIVNGPVAAYITDNLAIINWQTDKSADSTVYYGTDPLNFGQPFNSITMDTDHSVTLSGLAPNTVYYYQVSSKGIYTNTPAVSKILKFTTNSGADVTAPVITDGPTVIWVSDNAATIRWVTNEISDSRVKYQVQGGTSFLTVQNSKNVLEHMVTLTNLQASSTYFYQAASTDPSANASPYSTTLSFITNNPPTPDPNPDPNPDPIPPDTTPPVFTIQPSAATISNRSAVITWQTDEQSTSTVRYGKNPASLDLQTLVVGLAINHSVTLVNLDPETAYYFKAISLDRSVNGLESASLGPFTTVANDSIPDPFTFVAQTGSALNFEVLSNVVTITGINTASTISIAGAGGEYSISTDGGYHWSPFATSPSTVNLGDKVQVRLMSSGSNTTTTMATLTIGGVGGTFSVTTVNPSVNGACGGANGGTFTAAPATNLCSATGTVPTVTGSGPWSWICTGQYGGSNATCSANIQTYTVTFTSGGNGTLSGTASQTINYGGTTSSVTANSAIGYHFVNWAEGATQVSTSATFSINNVTSSHSYTANFAHDLLNGVCGSANGGTFTATPATNLCSATGTAPTVTGSGPWSWNCTGQYGGSNATCSANIQSYTVTFTSGGNGTLNGTTSQTVNYGGSASSVTAYPAAGYHFGNWTEGATQVSTSTTLSVGSVTSSHSYVANFAHDITNGACGSANGGIFTSAPASNLCSTTGTPPTVTGSGPWSWSCTGQYGGTTASCSANVASNPANSFQLRSGWNTIAVPYNTTGVQVSNFFNNPVSSIYEWIPTGATPETSNSQLGSYATVTTLSPGKGYFVKTSSSTLLQYSGDTNPTSTTLTLKPGWTMISNPNTTNKTNISTNWLIDGSPLGIAIVSNKIGGGIYSWNGSAYDSWSIIGDNPQIEPWKGYWILNLETDPTNPQMVHTLTIQ